MIRALRTIAPIRIAVVATALSAAAFAGAQPAPGTLRYTKVHALTPREGVFAYARVSPDGRRLVYAANIGTNVGNNVTWTETLVDLTTNRVLWTEPGIDAYWSPDGTRLIYAGNSGVVVRNVETGAVVVNPEAGSLGDYYSWAARDGRDLILTIESNYYYLNADKAVLPPAKVRSCDRIGTGERPLISKDGRRITTFVKGNVVVRGLDNCDNVFDTGIQGAKADFSWDGRYIAFHAVKTDGAGYEIKIVDVQDRTVRTLAPTGGSVLFPSWTKDGRLCFRYDGADYRGFMMASGVLDVPAVPLPGVSQPLPERRTWQDIFPETPAPNGVSLVLVWAPWSAHSKIAFDALEETRAYFATRLPELSIAAAADPGSAESDITRQLKEFGVTFRRVPLSSRGLLLTEARNQMPTIMLFRDGVLVDRKLGAQSFEYLKGWIQSTLVLK